MELVNPSAIQAITDDRLRIADAARLVAATRPARAHITARLGRNTRRPGRAPIFARLHLARS